MPNLTVVERDGKLVIMSETEANGGPADHYIAVRSDRSFISRATRQEADDFLKGHSGNIYLITHYWHKDEWLPQSTKIAEVSAT